MNPDEAQAYLDGRKEAAAKIDIETCEVLHCGIDEGDPYGVRPERAWGQSAPIVTDGFGW
jgi:hypothetical protein